MEMQPEKFEIDSATYELGLIRLRDCFSAWRAYMWEIRDWFLNHITPWNMFTVLIK